MYLPGPRAVIAVGLNSGVLGETDQIGALGAAVTKTLRGAARI